MPVPPFASRFSPRRLDTERNRLLLERVAWFGVGLSAAGLALVGYQFLLATALASTPTPTPPPLSRTANPHATRGTGAGRRPRRAPPRRHGLARPAPRTPWPTPHRSPGTHDRASPPPWPTATPGHATSPGHIGPRSHPYTVADSHAVVHPYTVAHPHAVAHADGDARTSVAGARRLVSRGGRGCVRAGGRAGHARRHHRPRAPGRRRDAVARRARPPLICA